MPPAQAPAGRGSPPGGGRRGAPGAAGRGRRRARTTRPPGADRVPARAARRRASSPPRRAARARERAEAAEAAAVRHTARRPVPARPSASPLWLPTRPSLARPPHRSQRRTRTGRGTTCCTARGSRSDPRPPVPPAGQSSAHTANEQNPERKLPPSRQEWFLRDPRGTRLDERDARSGRPERKTSRFWYVHDRGN